MKFRLFGIEIHVTVLFAVTVAFLLTIDRTGILIPMFAAAFLHEFGHIVAMKLFNTAPKQIILHPCSVTIVDSFPSHGGKSDIIISLSGPFANFIAALPLYIAFKFTGKLEFANWYAVQIITGAFNLIPVNGLDGGRILLILAGKAFGSQRAVLILKIVSLLFAGALIIAGITLIVRFESNPSLLFVGVYLAILNIIKL